MTYAADLRGRTLVDLGEALDGADEVAMLMAPTQSNPGDAAIWAGTSLLLDQLGVRVRYVATAATYDAGELRRHHPSGPILLRGGGNLGDLYPSEDCGRWRAVRELAGRRLIQAPQSVLFNHPSREPRRLLDGANFTLMVRERASADQARSLLGCDPVLCPDHALALAGELATTGAAHAATVDVVWVLRRDREGLGSGSLTASDWPGQTPADSAGWPVSEQRDWALFQLWNAAGRSGSGPLPMADVVALVTRVMRSRVQRAVRVVAEGRVVVTDRLHAVLLAWMLGRTVVMLPNSYHKNRSMYDTWFRQERRVIWADSVAEGTAIAGTATIGYNP